MKKIVKKKNPNKYKIIFCCYSNLINNNYGNTNNNRKLYNSISSSQKITSIFPIRDSQDNITFKSLKDFLFKYLKEICKSERIIITRGLKLAFIPVLLRHFFKNKIVVYLGCTPINFVERNAFEKNDNYYTEESYLTKFFYHFEPFIEKYVLRNSDRFIIENEKAKNLIILYGANERKIFKIPYYVQDYFLKYEKVEYNKREDVFKIGYTGRFNKYDVTIPMVYAISHLVKEGYKVKLYFIGDGPNKKNVENLVNQNKLSSYISFLGAKSHKELAKLLNCFHCLLLPMLANICPSTIAIKILEGVIKGKIIITTPSGNNPSLFMSKTDLILNNINSKELENKLKLVINNYDYYSKISYELSKFHKTIRNKQEYRNYINDLLNSLK